MKSRNYNPAVYKPFNITVITDLQNAYNKAAANSTGAAKPKFERLRDANAAVYASDCELSAIEEELRDAVVDVKLLAKTDKAAAKVWRECEEKRNTAVRKLFGI